MACVDLDQIFKKQLRSDLSWQVLSLLARNALFAEAMYIILPGYDPKTAKDHGNVEWLVTRRGLKQFFHTDCYIHMVKEHDSWVH